MNRLTDFLSRSIGIEPWIASLIAIAIATLLVNQIAQVLLRQAARVTARTTAVWDDALVQTASRPVLAAMWVIGASFMARVLQTQVELEFMDEVGKLRDVALIVCACWFLLRFIGKVCVQHHQRAFGARRSDRSHHDRCARQARPPADADRRDPDGGADDRIRDHRPARARRCRRHRGRLRRQGPARQFLRRSDDLHGPAVRRRRMDPFAGQADRRHGRAHQLAPHPDPRPSTRIRSTCRIRSSPTSWSRTRRA